MTSCGFLPEHGRVSCSICFGSNPVDFDVTKTGNADWRITNNPCAWGNRNPEVLVLGFSKGQTQAGALAGSDFDDVPFKNARKEVQKILHAIGLIRTEDDINKLISDRAGRFAFGSLIRCSVEQWQRKSGKGKRTEGWFGSGGNMLGRFVNDEWGRTVVTNCASRFLGKLPSATKLVILFGFGRDGDYVREAAKVIRAARGGRGMWRLINEVAYTDGVVTFVHVEHFKAQGRLLPDWLGQTRKNGDPPCPKRNRWRLAAREAVAAVYPDGLS